MIDPQQYDRIAQTLPILQQADAELGSSREVISRVIEDFAKRGLLRAGRGSIQVPDFGKLRDQTA